MGNNDRIYSTIAFPILSCVICNILMLTAQSERADNRLVSHHVGNLETDLALSLSSNSKMKNLTSLSRGLPLRWAKTATEL